MSPSQSLPFALSELGNTYADAHDRYIVSLIIGYSDHEADSPEDAVAHALELTRDVDSHGTHWYVYDRHTQTLALVHQSEAESLLPFLEF